MKTSSITRRDVNKKTSRPFLKPEKGTLSGGASLYGPLWGVSRPHDPTPRGRETVRIEKKFS